MTNEQPSTSDLVCVNVYGSADLSFFYDLSAAAIVTKSDRQPDCSIDLDESAYKRLLTGQSTFEIEVEKGNLKIKGQSKALLEFGSQLRKSSN